MSKKQLNLFDLVMIVVSLVIGMGIFRTPTVVANRTGTPLLFFLAWLAGGFIAFCGGLTYAEIGSRYPVTGGYYKIFSYGYHPSLAFAINCIVLVSNAGSIAGVGVIGAEYIGNFFYGNQPTPQLFKLLVTTGAVTFFYFINLLGLRMSSRVQNVLTIFKIVLILLLLTSVFGHHPILTHPQTAASADGDSNMGWLKALGFGLIAVSFTYGGYQQTINFGGEVRDASRVIPRGISIGVAVIIILYLSINFVYVRVIGFEQLKSADSIAAILMDHLFGSAGDRILRVLMFLSVLAYVNVSVMSNPRVMCAMSEEGILPAIFKKKTAGRDVIIWSLTAYSAAICLTLLFISTVEKILNYTIFLDSIGFATSASTIFILRWRKVRENEAIYRIKWYPAVPAILILAYIGVATSVVMNDPRAALAGAGIFAFCFLLYFAIRAWKKPA
ncbi:MAG TPA: amino acid permease [Puia sp.]|jgi:APA family basic amino acid/polyamine antiporter|nr:amino acid permease [Puia sp.]